MKKSTWIIVIAIVVVLIALDAVLMISYFNKKNGETVSEKDEFRLVKVESFSGDVTLERDDDDIDIFEDMNLIPKDDCETKEESEIVLLVDDDKHIVASANTEFKINAKGNPEKGKVNIELIKGEAVFTIDNKLSEKDEFNVNTPNASLSVRGTQFLVNYDPAEEKTLVKVFEGTVWGKGADEEFILEAGDSITVFNDRIASYVSDETYNELLAKYEEITTRIDDFQTDYYSYIDENGNYIETSVLEGFDGDIGAIEDYYVSVTEYVNMAQEEISEEDAIGAIGSLDDATNLLNTLEEEFEAEKDNVEEYKASNGWRDAYKAFIGENNLDGCLLNVYGDEVPEIIMYNSNGGGNGRYGNFDFYTCDLEGNASKLGSRGGELNEMYVTIDGTPGVISILNGPGTWTCNALQISPGSIKAGKKLGSGNMGNWPDNWVSKCGGTNGEESSDWYSNSELLRAIDSYELH